MDAKGKKAKRQASWRKKLREIRRLAVEEAVVLSPHAADRLFENDWTLDDVLSGLRSGVITEAQPDSIALDRKKYTIVGTDCFDNTIEMVGKIMRRGHGKEYFVITCYSPGG